ncbi:hypothetical protein D9M72_526500 [compost metagenome]
MTKSTRVDPARANRSQLRGGDVGKAMPALPNASTAAGCTSAASRPGCPHERAAKRFESRWARQASASTLRSELRRETKTTSIRCCMVKRL